MMYKLVHALLYLLSLLPLRVLYLLSDFFYFIIYRVAGYRKKVVLANLDIAFPEKPADEKKEIAKRFYKNFIDNFIETLKLLSGGSRFAAKHFKADVTLMEQMHTKGKRMQFHLGHNFNWELANVAVSSYTSYFVLVVYMPVKNQVFDKIMLKIRSSKNNALLPATDMKNAMIPYRSSQYLLALVADQVPGDPAKAYWMNFFGRPTPFMRGPERGAIAGNLAVAFAQIFKTKRGHYQLATEFCTEDASTMPPGEITRRYVKFLERVIRQHPDMWLWSHRRWKKDWKPEYAPLWIDDAPLPS